MVESHLPSVLLGLDAARGVLLVESCPQQAQHLRSELAQLGIPPIRLDWAADAETAWRLCREHAYQLLLCDDTLGAEQADGGQLLAALQREGWLATDCVVLMMTDDATLSRMRRLVALAPDGYLLKPVQTAIVCHRWPGWLARRQQLAPILTLLQCGLLSAAAGQVADVLAQSPEDAPGLALLQARIWMAQRQFDRAHNALLDLKGGPEGKRAQLALAELAMRRRYYALADSWLAALESDPLFCAMALTLGAENALRMHQFSRARQKLQQAISLAPGSVEPHWLLACVELADGTLLAAQQALQEGLRQDRPGLSWAGQLMPLLAAVQLDRLGQGEPAAVAALLQQFQQLCGLWQQQVGQVAYRPMALLLLGRRHCLLGAPQQGALCLTQYQRVCQRQQGQRPLLEQMELVKLLRLLGDPEAEVQLGQLNRQLADATDRVEHLAWRLYLARWCALPPLVRACDAQEPCDSVSLALASNEVSNEA
ncbi:response regulator [Pseudaeromonas paramecii]|uniref:Response regulatory domain-containing protein n=1 Tax=Pseudaeromonas paramecii TaxID=2138166 RepID=A0ABP8QIN1_9GAMM